MEANMAMPQPTIGDERFLLETISTANVEAMARARGWQGGEDMEEFCEPDEAARHSVHKTLQEAASVAKAWLSAGHSFSGRAMIERQVYEEPRDDGGNPVLGLPRWKSRYSYEITMDGEPILVSE
jgi:hypothetical protein